MHAGWDDQGPFPSLDTQMQRAFTPGKWIAP
jgi:hypothetical protein